MGGREYAEFGRNLAWGQVGESDIARYLRRRGGHTIALCETANEHEKHGPRLLGCGEALTLPDLLSFRNGKASFIEAKQKKHFAWNRSKGVWVTGIDERHWHHYLKVQDRTAIPVWLLFLHKSDETPEWFLRYGAPPICPSGLFAQEIQDLARCIFDRNVSKKGGATDKPMVYWHWRSLIRIASVEQVCPPPEPRASSGDFAFAEDAARISEPAS